MSNAHSNADGNVNDQVLQKNLVVVVTTDSTQADEIDAFKDTEAFLKYCPKHNARAKE